MKKLFTVAAIALATSATAFAADPCPKDALHCIYDTSVLIQGKWIGINTQGDIAPKPQTTLCVASNWFIYINKESATFISPGAHNVKFLQCTDNTCNDSRILLDDTFTVAKGAGGTTTITPNRNTFAMDRAYGKDCAPPANSAAPTNLPFNFKAK